MFSYESLAANELTIDGGRMDLQDCDSKQRFPNGIRRQLVFAVEQRWNHYAHDEHRHSVWGMTLH